MTDEQRTYLTGKQLSHRKKRQWDRSNQYKKTVGVQNEPIAKTYNVIAKECNVSPSTVKRAEQYAESIDRIAETQGEEVKEKILSGELKTTQNATGRDNFTKTYKRLNHVAKTSPRA